MSIWIPSHPQEALDMARCLNANNSHDLVLLHAAFGHHFNGDMGLVMTQGYVLKGKPTLNADAMAGICRRSGLCRYIKLVVWDETRCVLETARTDEPESITHTFEFNMQMAQAQGLTRNRNWSQMPRQMLRARALTLGLRAAFPDAVAGIYSSDEIADNTNMSDDERDVITAQALGTDMPSRAPRPQRQHSTPPQRQHSAPPQRQHSTPPQQHEQVKLGVSPLDAPNRCYDFSTIDGFSAAVKGWELDPVVVSNVLEERAQKAPMAMNHAERETFFYRWLAPDFMRRASSVDRWWALDPQTSREYHEELTKQHPILKFIQPKHFGYKLAFGAFSETLKMCGDVGDQLKRDQIINVLETMEPTDWSAYDFVGSIISE